MVRALDVISMHLLWIVLGVIYLSVSPTSALIPEQCVHNVTTPYAVCCPIDPNNGMVCGGPHRGYCEKIVVPHEDIPPMFHMDDRLAWPLRYFSHTCQCNDRFFGVACERCWFGWTGPKCDIPKKIVRRDIRSLSPRELEIHKVLMKKSETWPSGYAVIDETNNWNSDPLNAPRFVSASVHHYIAFLHRFGSRSTLYKNEKDCNDYAILNFNHDGVVFPTWHRHYNLVWEMLLGDIAFKLYGIHDYAIPYWDFIGLKSCDICTNKYFGAPGKEDEDGVHLSRHSLFHNTTEHCYEPEDGTACFGCRRDKRPSTITRHFRALDFPTQMDLEYVLSLKRYFYPGERNMKTCQSFHMALEGFCGRPGTNGQYLWMHNRIHSLIDGSMCCAGTAANDPMFLTLHSFVDKIFETWLRMHQITVDEYPVKDVRPGHSRHSFAIGLLPLVRNSDMFVTSSKLGYEYDDYLFGKHAENKEPTLVVHVN